MRLALSRAAPAALASVLLAGSAACARPASRGPDRAPVLARADPLPRYPGLLWSQGVEGAADLRVAVDAAGRAAPLGPRPADGVALFWLAARDAVRGWAFAPARRGGRPAADTVRVRAEFALDSAPPCPPPPPPCAGGSSPAAPTSRATVDTAALRVRVVACRARLGTVCSHTPPARPGAA